jgi:hypothetical protein
MRFQVLTVRPRPPFLSVSCGNPNPRNWIFQVGSHRIVWRYRRGLHRIGSTILARKMYIEGCIVSLGASAPWGQGCSLVHCCVPKVQCLPPSRYSSNAHSGKGQMKWASVLVTFLVTMKKYLQKQPKGDRIYFSSVWESSVHSHLAPCTWAEHHGGSSVW